jgi:hypothetical protein
VAVGRNVEGRECEEDQKREGSKFGVEMEAGSSSFYRGEVAVGVCGGVDMAAAVPAARGLGNDVAMFSKSRRFSWR